MEIPISFLWIADFESMEKVVNQLAYPGDARSVAFWWDEGDNQIAWADSKLKVAVGLGDSDWWQTVVRSFLPLFEMGAHDVKAKQVLVWDRIAN